jgi:hypothetical protein
MTKNNITNGVKDFNFQVSTHQFLNHVEQYINTMIENRGVILPEKIYEKTADSLLNQVYPLLCGVLDGLHSDHAVKPGLLRLQGFMKSLKQRGI